MTNGSTVIPGLRYADPQAAVDWLTSAFGFEEQAIHRDEQGRIVHAQLSLGSGMVMLGPDDSPDMKDRFSTPRQLGGRSTQAVYVVVPDADAHHARSQAAGATILKPLADASYGGRGYTCSDMDGHVWEFGTYDPWA